MIGGMSRGTVQSPEDEIIIGMQLALVLYWNGSKSMINAHHKECGAKGDVYYVEAGWVTTLARGEKGKRALPICSLMFVPFASELYFSSH